MAHLPLLLIWGVGKFVSWHYVWLEVTKIQLSGTEVNKGFVSGKKLLGTGNLVFAMASISQPLSLFSLYYGLGLSSSKLQDGCPGHHIHIPGRMNGKRTIDWRRYTSSVYGLKSIPTIPSLTASFRVEKGYCEWPLGSQSSVSTTRTEKWREMVGQRGPAWNSGHSRCLTQQRWLHLPGEWVPWLVIWLKTSCPMKGSGLVLPSLT